MKVAGSSPDDALGASGQLNNVETAERRPRHDCGGPARMRSTQEASRLLATVRDRSPTVTYAPIGSPLYPPSVLKQTLRSGQLEARRTASSVVVVIFWRMRGEVQRPQLVAPGYDRYGSGLRDRPANLERSWTPTPYCEAGRTSVTSARPGRPSGFHERGQPRRLMAIIAGPSIFLSRPLPSSSVLDWDPAQSYRTGIPVSCL
jgi:hypothetical protein